jgi:hypothetical protein
MFPEIAAMNNLNFQLAHEVSFVCMSRFADTSSTSIMNIRTVARADDLEVASSNLNQTTINQQINKQ